MKTTPEIINNLKPNEIFVFGSNLQGMHAGGAARCAMKWGAEWGNGNGIQGQTYAIPTLSFPGGTEEHMLSVNEIGKYVDEFISFTESHPNYEFLVTPIGCGIAGFTPQQIAPLFRNALGMVNVSLPESFLNLLENKKLTLNNISEAISSTLKKYITEGIDEMAYPASFNMEEFKSLPSFKARIEYCQARLPRISSGSSRIVYKIDDEKVLKLAKNKKGIQQNDVESDKYLQTIGCFAKVYDFDQENYLWLEMQIARKAKASDFLRLTGFNFETICHFIEYNKARYSRYSYCPKEWVSYFESEKFMPYYDDYDSIIYQLYEYLGNYSLEAIGDLKRLSSWGVVQEDGEEHLVLIDYGLNDDIFNNYYK